MNVEGDGGEGGVNYYCMYTDTHELSLTLA